MKYHGPCPSLPFDFAAVVLAAGAMVATLRYKVGLLPVLGVSAALGVLWKLTLGA